MCQFVCDPAVVDETDGLVEHQVSLKQVLGTALHKHTLVLLHLTQVDVAQTCPSLLYPYRKTHHLLLLTNVSVLLLPPLYLRLPLPLPALFDVSEGGVHSRQSLEDGHARAARVVASFDLHHAPDVEIPLEKCSLFHLLEGDALLHIHLKAPLDQIPQLHAHPGVELLVTDVLADGRPQLIV